MPTAEQERSFGDSFWSNRLLNAIVEIQAAFIEESNIRLSFTRMLDCLLELTESEYGFLGEVLYTPEGLPYLKTHGMTDISWNQKTKQLYDSNMANGFEFRNLNTLFGVTLATGEVVISNDPENDHRSGGLPAGHPGMRNYLGVPIKHRNEMLGMLGVANRGGGFDADIVDALSPLLVTAGSMIQSMRSAAANHAIKEQLKEKNELLDGVIHNISDTLVITDYRGQILEVNRAAESMFDCRFQELSGKSITICLSEESSSRYEETISQFLLTGDPAVIEDRCEMEVITHTGRKVPVDLAVNDIKFGHQKLFVNVIQDISVRKAQDLKIEQANIKLLELSETDELTGLYNRRYFDKGLRNEFNRDRKASHELALALIDIDHFKDYNDNYGHPAGDQCLKRVGHLLREYFKRSGEFVARVGGEEFAVVMADMDSEECVSALQGLIEKMKSENIEHAYSCAPYLSLSIGLAQRCGDDLSASQLYERADAALYSAKEGGRNRFVFALEPDRTEQISGSE